MVVWTIVNVEDWSIERAMPRTVLPPPMGQPLLPDLPNWAWHEYGNRVGFWRLYDCMQKFGITPTLALNGIVCRSHPRIAEAAKDAGWEFMAHGYVQGPMHKVDDQRAAIRDTIAAIREFTGEPRAAGRARGSPRPTRRSTSSPPRASSTSPTGCSTISRSTSRPAHGPVVSIPYTVETNDIPMMLIQHHGAEEMLKRGVDHFDRLYEESAKITRVMAISVHPYISGVPHRIGYLERLYAHIKSKPGVAFWTGERILDWYRTQVAAPA